MKIAVGVKIIDKISIYWRSCLMWVYTCCLLLVSTYLYRYVLCFYFFLFCCCLCWKFSAPSRGEGNSKPWPAQIHGKYPVDHARKTLLNIKLLYIVSGRFYFRQIQIKLVFLMGATNILVKARFAASFKCIGE